MALDNELLIDTDPVAKEDNLIDLNTPQISPLNPRELQNKTERYAYAAGQDSPGPSVIYQQLLQGQESMLRDHLARKESLRVESARHGMITEFLQSKNGAPMTPEEYEFFLGLSQKQVKNPKLIVEELAAKRIIRDLYGNNADGVQQRAYQENFDTANVIQDVAEQLLIKKQYAYDQYKAHEARWNSMNIIRKAEDVTNNIVLGGIPFLYQWRMHDVVDPPYPTSFFTGNNKGDQYSYLMSLPPDEFQRVFDAGLADLNKSSPMLAMDFIRGFMGYSSTESFLENTFNVLDIASVVAPVAKTIKAAGGAAFRPAPFKPGARTFTKETIDGIRNPIGPTSQAEIDRTQALEEVVKARYQNTPPVQLADELGVSEQEIEAIIYRLDNPVGRDVPQTIEQAIFERYRDTPPAQLAEDLGVEEAEVARIIQKIEESPFSSNAAAHIPGTGYAGDFGRPVIPDPNLLPPELAAVDQFATSMRQTIQSFNPAKPDLKEMAAAAGSSDGAAAARLAEIAVGKTRADEAAEMQDLFSQIPSFVDPALNFRGAFKLAREYADTIADELARSSELLARALRGGISSLPETAMQQAFEAARLKVKQSAERWGVNDAIIDFDTILPEDTIGNVGSAVMRLGRPDKTMFKSADEANNFIAQYGIKDGKVLQSGDGYLIQVQRKIDETDRAGKNYEISTNLQTPRSWFTTLLDGAIAGGGRFRTPSNTLSLDQRGQRQVAIQGLSEFARLVELAGRPLSNLPWASRRNLSRFLDVARRYEDVLPDGSRVKGIEFPDQGSFEVAWTDLFGRLPTPEESKGYWMSQNLNQYDWVLRNLTVHHYLARNGVRTWIPAKGLKPIQAKEVKKIDWDNPEGNILFIPTKGDLKLYMKPVIRRGDKEFRDRLDDLIENQGYKLLQTVNPFEHDTGAPVHFILTKTGESTNLPLRLVPYKGGGHIAWDYQAFVKQPKISAAADTINYHTGDNALIPATTLAEAKKLAKNLKEAARLYKAKDQGFATFVRNNLPMDPEVLFNKFKNGVISPDAPIVAVRSGESTLRHSEVQSLFGDNVRSWSDSDLNIMKGLNTEFLGRRGWDPKGLEVADESDPLFAAPGLRMIDPLPMISQALGRAGRHRMLQPYQIRSAEHFIEEFHTVLKDGVARLDYYRQNPMATLVNPPWDLQSADRSTLAAARAYQHAALNLIGTSTEFGRFDKWMRGRLMDSIYNAGGKRTSEVVYDHLYLIPDPITFARQVAFHLKLGLFNPVQLWLQYQTFTNTLALAPRHAMQGLAGGFLMRMVTASGRLDKEGAFAAHFANLATNFGWKKDEFLEAFEFMRDSGIHNIGPQHAFKSDTLDPEIFRSGGRAMLNKATFFFNEGERGNHLAGFATAYMEWRRANPLAKLTREEKAKILARYDDLTVNMTHASSSGLNRGLGAVAGQFFSYQQRLAELFLGKRLSPMEKVRALSIYSMMYGIPVTGAAVTTGATSLASLGPTSPINLGYDDFREYLMSNHPGAMENPVVKGMMNGIPSLLMEYAFGEETTFQTRYGPAGLQIWKDIRDGDITLWQLLTGASVSIQRDIWESAWPALHDIYRFIGDQENASVQVTLTDTMEVLKNVSTINNAMKAYYAFTTQKYMNKGQQIVDDEVNAVEAVLLGVFGMTPARINDRQLMEDAIKGRAEGQLYARNQAKRYFRMGWREEDPDLREKYFHSGRTWMMLGDLDSDERSRLVGEAITEAETLVDSSKRKFQETFGVE